MKRLTKWLQHVCDTIVNNTGEIILAGIVLAAIAMFGSIGYSVHIYQADVKELDKAYVAMNNGNYAWAMEQFQYVLDKQEERGRLWESGKIIRSATTGLESATTIYHYNSALEYYADENWVDAIYHFGQVIDYRDSFALWRKCLDAYTMTYYNENAPG